jgi:hypothetical protein
MRSGDTITLPVGPLPVSGASGAGRTPTEFAATLKENDPITRLSA